MTSAGMTSAAIYARVSSARQKKDETIGSQTAALRAHAEQLGLDVPEEWVFEDEGHSGATLVRPALERLRDLVAGVGIDVVLCYSPDRLARKFAYQALLIEEFTRAGTRVEFVKGPRGDSPEDQLLVQFQGMFAEYEKAQILERYRRGKTHRAKTGSINVLCGAPFGYRYVRKNDAHRRGLRDRRTRGRAGRRAVPPLRRRRRLHRRPGPLAHRAAGADPHRQAPLGPQRGLGHAAQPRLRRARGVRQDHGRARLARPEPGGPPAGTLHAEGVQDRRPARGEGIEIPVPAIVSEDTFARVAQRLADNKRFASRNSRDPSLLQGLAACSACGYGYYRTSTRTTNKKIYYYRCLGSDDYRYENGRVCANKPVRADYLDTVVWDHITGLLADPAADPRRDRQATGHRPHRRPGRPRAAAPRDRVGQGQQRDRPHDRGFGEQLITIDELRARMPDLRARETNLRNQLDALDSQLADREAYLALAADLEGFLTQLHTRAETSTVDERRRVLKLLVKDVLIGAEKITIRHRIPLRERITNDPQPAESTDTEGEHRQHCQVRWGRDQSVAPERCSARDGGCRRGAVLRHRDARR